MPPNAGGESTTALTHSRLGVAMWVCYVPRPVVQLVDRHGVDAGHDSAVASCRGRRVQLVGRSVAETKQSAGAAVTQTLAKQADHVQRVSLQEATLTRAQEANPRSSAMAPHLNRIASSSTVHAFLTCVSVRYTNRASLSGASGRLRSFLDARSGDNPCFCEPYLPNGPLTQLRQTRLCGERTYTRATASKQHWSDLAAERPRSPLSLTSAKLLPADFASLLRGDGLGTEGRSRSGVHVLSTLLLRLPDGRGWFPR